MEDIKPVEGQCGTCAFAQEFDYGPAPSDENEGVHCTSEGHARWLDADLKGNQTTTSSQDQIREYGFIDLFRWEVMADEDFCCPQWQRK